MIFCRTEDTAKQSLDDAIYYLENRLLLKVNRHKTYVKEITGITYLGFGFRRHLGQVQLYVPMQARKNLVSKLYKMLRPGATKSIKNRFSAANAVLQGWLHYYKIGFYPNHFLHIDDSSHQ